MHFEYCSVAMVTMLHFAFEFEELDDPQMIGLFIGLVGTQGNVVPTEDAPPPPPVVTMS